MIGNVKIVGNKRYIFVPELKLWVTVKNDGLTPEQVADKYINKPKHLTFKEKVIKC